MTSLAPALPCAESRPLEQVRYVCTLGALASVIAIPGAQPITHCGPGCASKQFHALSGISGYQGGEFQVPSTNIGNREVIFGGADRLDTVIDATLKVMDADLFVVLSGCVPALIGDDVANVVARHRKHGAPIVLAETSGYQGNNFTGHEIVVRAIIDQFADRHAGPTRPDLVNVWSLLPYQHPFWRGDLEEIHRLLDGIGLEVNILFGHSSQGVEEWRQVPRAAFNLVLGPWLGLETARHLEAKYGQPFLHLPTLPIGARATGSFLREIGAFTGRDPRQVDRFIAAEERRYYLYLRDFTSFYAGCTSQYRLPSALLVVGDSAYVLAVAAFMLDQLGLVPARLIVTENPPETVRPGIAAAVRAVVGADDVPVHFADDGYEINRILRATDLTGHLPILFGTTWENEVAKALDAPLIEIGYPCTDEVVLSRASLGYRGALQLIERVYTTVVRAETMG